MGTFGEMGYLIQSCLLILALCPESIEASSDLYEYGFDLGDQLACPMDDSAYGPLDLRSQGLPFGNKVFDEAYVGSNGYVTFGAPFTSFTPEPFPIYNNGYGSDYSNSYSSGGPYPGYNSSSYYNISGSGYNPYGSSNDGWSQSNIPDDSLSGWSDSSLPSNLGGGWSDSSFPSDLPGGWSGSSSPGASTGGWFDTSSSSSSADYSSMFYSSDPSYNGWSYNSGPYGSNPWSSYSSGQYHPYSSYPEEEMCYYYYDAEGNMIFSHRDYQNYHSSSYSHSWHSSASGNCNFTEYLPLCQPYNNYNYGQVEAIIAPFWHDIDPRINGGKLYYRLENITSASNVLSRAKDEIWVGTGEMFQPTNALIATWENVQQYSTCNGLENTFQVVIVWNSTTSYTIVKYEKLEWGYGQVGYQADSFYCELEGSRTNGMQEVNLQSNVGIPGTWIFGISENNMNATDCYLNITGYDLEYSSSPSYYNHMTYNSTSSYYNSNQNYSSYSSSFTISSGYYSSSFNSSMYSHYSSYSSSYPSNSYYSSNYFGPSYPLQSSPYCSYCSYDFSYVSIPCKSHKPAIGDFFPYGPEFGDMEACKDDSITSLVVYLPFDIPFGSSHYSRVYVSSLGLISFQRAVTSYMPVDFPLPQHLFESSSQWYNSAESSHYSSFGFSTFNSDGYSSDDSHYSSFDSPSFNFDGYSSSDNSFSGYHSSEYLSSFHTDMCLYYLDENGNYTLPYPMDYHEYYDSDCDFSKQGINLGYCYHSDYNTGYLEGDMIAVLWDDTDIRKGNGKTYARFTSDPETLDAVYIELQNVSRNASWYPHSAVIATWTDLEQYKSCDKTASFQAVLAWDDYSSYVLVRYDHVDWTYPKAGFNTWDNLIYCNMHKESYTTDSWGVGLTLNTFDHEQCFTDGISIETTSPVSESSSPSNVPSASWLPCKDYSSYSSSWDHYSSLYDYGFTFNDTLACPVDDDSYGPLDVEINGITIGSVLYTKLYVTSNGLISFGGPFASFTPVPFPFDEFSSASSSSYYSGSTYSGGSDSIFNSPSVDLSSTSGYSFGGWSESSNHDSASSSGPSDWSYFEGSSTPFPDFSYSYGPQYESSYEEMCYYYVDANGSLVFSHRSYSYPYSSSYWYSSSYDSSSWYSSGSGNCELLDYLPGCEPESNDTSGEPTALISAFWTDIDLRLGNGKLHYGFRNTSEAKFRASTDIQDATGNFFYPENVFVVTWEDVQQYGTCNGLENTFQAVLVWNSSSTYVILTYAKLEWGSAQVGFDAGNFHCVLNGSRTHAIEQVLYQSNFGPNGKWIFKLSEENNDNDPECYMDVSGYDYPSSYYSNPSYSLSSSLNNPSYNYQPYSSSFHYTLQSGFYSDSLNPSVYDTYSSYSSSYSSNSYYSSNYFGPSYPLQSSPYCSYCSYDFSYVSIPCKSHQPAIGDFFPYGPEFGDMEACKYDSITSLVVYLPLDIPFGSSRYSRVYVSSLGLISFQRAVTSYMPVDFPLPQHLFESSSQWYNSAESSHYSSFGFSTFNSDGYSSDDSHYSSFDSPSFNFDGYSSSDNSFSGYHSSEYLSSFHTDMCLYYLDENGNYTLPYPMDYHEYYDSDCDFSKQGINLGYCYHSDYNTGYLEGDMIAVLWDDTDIRKGNGKTYARFTSDPETLDAVYIELQNVSRNASWYPHSAVIATWTDLEQYKSCDKTASFQAVLAWDDYSSYVLVRYDHVDWTHPKAGFNTWDNLIYCNMHKESYTTDSWGVGLTLNTFDHEQCFTDGISIETTSPVSESSSPSNVPSASWLPCKDYSSYSSSWDHYSSLYDYGFTFNDTLACPVDDDSYGPLDVEINGITIGSVLYTKLYVTSNGLISFGGPFASFTPVPFPFDEFSSASSSSYYSGSTYSGGSDSIFNSPSVDLSSTSGYSFGGWSESSNHDSASSSGPSDWSYFEGSSTPFPDFSYSYGPQYESSYEEMCYYYVDANGSLVFSHRSYSYPYSSSYWYSSSYDSSSWYSSGSGNCELLDYLPGCEPESNDTSGEPTALISAFWTDIDLRLGNGKLHYGFRNTSEAKFRASTDIQDATGNFFYPENVFVVTWEDVQQYGTCNGLENTFQAVLVWNSSSTYVILTYAKLEWGSAQVGFDAGNFHCVLNGSRTHAIEQVLYQSNFGPNGKWIFKLSEENNDNDPECYMDVSGYDYPSSYYSNPSYSLSSSLNNPSYNYQPYSSSFHYTLQSGFYSDSLNPSVYDTYSSYSSSYSSNSYYSSNYFGPSYPLQSSPYCSYCSYDFSYVSIPCKSHQPAIGDFFPYGPEFGDMEACKYDSITSLVVYLPLDIPFGSSRYSRVYVSSLGLISFQRAVTSYMPVDFPLPQHLFESSSQWYNSAESSHYSSFGFSTFNSNGYSSDDSHYSSFGSPSFNFDGYSSSDNSFSGYHSSEYLSSSHTDMCLYYLDENGNYTLPYPMDYHEYYDSDCDFSKQGINLGYCYHSDYNTGYLEGDMIAVLWDDTDIRKGNGKTYARFTSDPETLDAVYIELQNVSRNASWYPHSAVIATWTDLEQYESCDKTASFQAVLAWDDYSSYVLVRYDHVDWTHPKAGFNTWDNLIYCNMHKESYTTDSWGVGLTLNTFDHEQCFTDGISIETTSPTSESSSPSNVPSASWLPCKDYSSYSSSWDHYSSLYDYGFTFNDTLACPVDDDSYGPLDVEINGITIGSVLFTKLYVTSNGLISFGGPFASFTPVPFPFDEFSSASNSYYSGSTYSGGSDSIFNSPSVDLSSTSGYSFGGWSESSNHDSASNSGPSDWSYFEGSSTPFPDFSYSYGPQYESSYEEMCYYYVDANGSLVFSHRSYSYPYSSSYWYSSSYDSSSWYSSGSGNCELLDYLPGCEPESNDTSGEPTALISAFWTDIDLRLGNGKLHYGFRNTSEAKFRASTDIQDATGNLFYPENVFVVTWEDVQQYGTCNGLENTFQAVLVWNSSSTYVILTYAKLEWGSAQVGFDAGNFHCVLNGSRTHAIEQVLYQSNFGPNGKWIFKLSEENNGHDPECYMDVSGYDYPSSYYNNPSYSSSSSFNNPSYSYQPYSSSFDYTSQSGFHSDSSNPSIMVPYPSYSSNYPSNNYYSSYFFSPSYSYESPSYCSYCSYDFSYITIPCKSHQPAIGTFYLYGPEFGDIEACKYDGFTTLNIYTQDDIPFGSTYHNKVNMGSNGVLSFTKGVWSQIPEKFPLTSIFYDSSHGYDNSGCSYCSNFNSQSYSGNSQYYRNDTQSDLCYYYLDENGNYTLTSPMESPSYQPDRDYGYNDSQCDFSSQGINSHYCHNGDYYNDFLVEDMIAVLWASADIRIGKGKMYLRHTVNDLDLTQVKDDVYRATGNNSWNPNGAVIATWENLHFAGDCSNKTASFQAALTWDSFSTYIVMKYHHIDWPSAKVGFNTGEENLYLNLVESSSPGITELVHQTNAGNLGTWVMGLSWDTYDKISSEIDLSSYPTDATMVEPTTPTFSSLSGMWLPCKEQSSYYSHDWSSLYNFSSFESYSSENISLDYSSVWGSYFSQGNFSGWSSTWDSSFNSLGNYSSIGSYHNVSSVGSFDPSSNYSGWSSVAYSSTNNSYNPSLGNYSSVGPFSSSINYTDWSSVASMSDYSGWGSTGISSNGSSFGPSWNWSHGISSSGSFDPSNNYSSWSSTYSNAYSSTNNSYNPSLGNYSSVGPFSSSINYTDWSSVASMSDYSGWGSTGISSNGSSFGPSWNWSHGISSSGSFDPSNNYSSWSSTYSNAYSSTNNSFNPSIGNFSSVGPFSSSINYTDWSSVASMSDYSGWSSTGISSNGSSFGPSWNWSHGISSSGSFDPSNNYSSWSSTYSNAYSFTNNSFNPSIGNFSSVGPFSSSINYTDWSSVASMSDYSGWSSTGISSNGSSFGPSYSDWSSSGYSDSHGISSNGSLFGPSYSDWSSSGYSDSHGISSNGSSFVLSSDWSSSGYSDSHGISSNGSSFGPSYSDWSSSDYSDSHGISSNGSSIVLSSDWSSSAYSDSHGISSNGSSFGPSYSDWSSSDYSDSHGISSNSSSIVLSSDWSSSGYSDSHGISSNGSSFGPSYSDWSSSDYSDSHGISSNGSSFGPSSSDWSSSDNSDSHYSSSLGSSSESSGTTSSSVNSGWSGSSSASSANSDSSSASDSNWNPPEEETTQGNGAPSRMPCLFSTLLFQVPVLVSLVYYVVTTHPEIV